MLSVVGTWPDVFGVEPHTSVETGGASTPSPTVADHLWVLNSLPEWSRSLSTVATR